MLKVLALALALCCLQAEAADDWVEIARTDEGHVVRFSPSRVRDEAPLKLVWSEIIWAENRPSDPTDATSKPKKRSLVLNAVDCRRMALRLQKVAEYDEQARLIGSTELATGEFASVIPGSTNEMLAQRVCVTAYRR